MVMVATMGGPHKASTAPYTSNCIIPAAVGWVECFDEAHRPGDGGHNWWASQGLDRTLHIELHYSGSGGSHEQK